MIGLIERKALCRAKFPQVIRRALHRGRQTKLRRASACNLLRRDVRPDGHLRLPGGICRHLAVLQRVDAVFSGQRNNKGLHAVIEGQAGLGNAQHGVFLQRHADLRHLSAGDCHASCLAQGVALRHLCLAEGIAARCQTARVKAVLHAVDAHRRTILRGELKADLRQRFVVQLAANQLDMHTAQHVIAAQLHLCGLRIGHFKAHALIRAGRIRHKGNVLTRFKAHRNKAILPRRERGDLFAIQSAHADMRAGHCRERVPAALVKLLHAHRNARRAVLLMNERDTRRFARIRRHSLSKGSIVRRRRRDCLHRERTGMKQRRDRKAAVIRRDLDAPARLIRNRIHRAANGRFVFIDRQNDQPRHDAGEHNAFHGPRQLECFGLCHNAQPCGVLLRHAQTVGSRQRLHEHSAILSLHHADFLARLPNELELVRHIKCLHLQASVLADIGAQQRIALGFNRTQLSLHLRKLTRYNLDAQRAILRFFVFAGKRAQHHVLRRLHRQRVRARCERGGDRLVAAIERIRSKHLTRRLARERHARARGLAGSTGAERDAALRLCRRQLDHRRGAALHDHKALAHRQHVAALTGEPHGILSLQQRGLRHARLIGDDRHGVFVAQNVHMHTGQRRFVCLSILADGGNLHRQLHGTGGRVLKRHARARRIDDLHADAVGCLGNNVRFPSRHHANRIVYPLREVALLHTVDTCALTGKHSLSVFIADKRLRLPVLGDDSKAHARNRMTK